MSSFDDAFETLMGSEGKYTDNQKDPGGATCWGITERVARAYGYKGAMQDLPLDTAKAIAKGLYWDPLKCDEYDPRVAFQIFDANYNGGHCIIWSQGCVGVKVDGLIGPKTIAAIKAADPHTFILRFNSLRLTYYTSLKTWTTFGRGWTNRIAKNLMKGATPCP